MKRLISIILLITFALSFVSCNDGDGNTDNNNGVEKEVINVSSQKIVELNKSKSAVDMAASENYKLYDSCKDDRYYYYFFFIGSVENVPLQDNYDTFKFTGNEFETKLSTIKTEGKTVEHQVENIISTNRSWQNTISAEYSQGSSAGAGVELDIFKFSAGLERQVKLGFQGCWGESKTTTASEMSKTVKEYSETISREVTLKFDNTCKQGYYRYILMGVFDVYAVVVYDTDSKQFNLATKASLYNQYYMLDYSEDSHFDDNSFDEIEVNESRIDLSKLGESKIPEKEIEEVAKSITVELNKHLCKLDSKYNPETNGKEKDGENDHSQFEMGHMVLYGCEQLPDGTYVVTDQNSFKLEYIFDVNTKKLPNTRNNELKVSDDEEKYVVNTDLQNKKIGYGAYCIRVKGKNGSTLCDPIVVTGFMKDKTVGSVENLLASRQIDPFSVGKLEITIVYELYFYANWFDHHHTNWRIDCELVFE